MIILIPGIPEETGPNDLHRLLKSCMQNVWLLPVFRRKGKIEKCEVLRIRDPENQRTEHQGLAYIDDEIVGEALIKQVSSCRIGGHTLKPRVYYSRSNRKERRINPTEPGNLAIVDRRRNDRRRDHLIIERLPEPLAPYSATS